MKNLLLYLMPESELRHASENTDYIDKAFAKAGVHVDPWSVNRNNQLIIANHQ